jgi:16S rRNA (cytosine967-C5)-methyltransferase
LGRIDWILTGFHHGQFSKSTPDVKNAMRVALYQILFLDKIPDFAAVNEAVEFVKKFQGEKPAGLTNAILRNIIRKKDAINYPDKDEDYGAFLSVYYSHPFWLVKRWIKRYGNDFTENLIVENNKKPTLTLRVNNLVTSINELENLLKSVDLGFSGGKFLPNFLQLHNLTNIAEWEYFKKGYFSLQDESTGLPCILLDVEPGMKVLDFCAAPGGKTGYIAEIMNNRGDLVAVDKFESRLKILESNLARLKINNVRSVVSDAFDFDEKDFDRIIIDAPCSGFGTLTKKPDIKWKKDLGDIRKIANLQFKLLVKASELLSPNGYLVYSTCTIEPEENYSIIKEFLLKNPNFSLVNAQHYVNKSLVDQNGCIQTYPNVHGIDGSFAAKLKKEY